MEVAMIEGVRTLTLDLISTTTLALLLLLLGSAIRKKFPVFERLCIPASVIGGLLFAILALILRNTSLLEFTLDTTLQTPFMIAFFACVGFSGSFKLLKSGGKVLITFLVLCWGIAIVQNIVGVSLAKAFDINPILGVMAGAVSLTGGHGNAAAFGQQAEAMGVTGAMSVAVAAATYGLIAGSLSGGPIGSYLIDRNKVKIETEDIGITEEELHDSDSDGSVTVNSIFKHMGLVGVFMVLGGLITVGVEKLNIPNFALPGYVGAMFIAIIFRNLNDKFKLAEIKDDSMEFIQSIGLGIFLTMAIMTLKIWELAALAIPLIAILAVQTIIVFLVIFFIVWPLMGKDYDAATMAAGYTGVGLGVTATAIASMTAVNEKYKKTSVKAMLVVPLCCAVFIDIVAIPAILFFLGKYAP